MLRKGRVFKEKQYLILEYASKGELFNYILYLKKGLKKEYAKVIFAKILRGVLSFHNQGICHRDLKLENILLDENFNPKIADFGFAAYNKKLKEFLGTDGYAAPEVYVKNKIYDGFKVDIFSLGVILFNLYTGNIPFKLPFKNDILYGNIILENYENYWKNITVAYKGINNFKDLKDFNDFKDLYNKMISYKPKKRPTIIEILKSEWMKEVRDLTEDQLQKLEEEIIEEFLKRESMINEVLEVKTEDETFSSLNCDRGIEDNYKTYFDFSLKPKYAKTGLGMNFIKIEGNLSPADFMNNLANKIDQKFKDNCKIEESKGALKFKIIFEEEIEDEEEISKELQEKFDELGIEENEEININLLKKDCIIQCKLYQSLNGGHFLKFSKKSGDLEDYYNKLEIIISLVKEIL